MDLTPTPGPALSSRPPSPEPAPERKPAPDASVAPAAGSRRLPPDVALSGLYEISKIVTSPQRLEVVMANTVSVLSAFLRMTRGLVVLIDRDGEPELVATGGGLRPAPGATRDYVPQKAIDQIVATATPLVVHDVAASPLFDETYGASAGGARIAYLGVPIRAGDRVVGALSIDRVRDGGVEFRIDEDIRFLTMVANLLGQVVRMHRLLAADRDLLINDRARLQRELSEQAPAPGPLKQSRRIVGESEPMRALLKTIARVAPTTTTVLLRGESGTGKELLAQAIHENSHRRDKPFVKLNCAALAESVLESELFGHEKGAFTSAVAAKPGRFEMADGGTLFLDEIGEISGSFQAKLLRVLQEGEFERVGGVKTVKVDVRLVCATNRDLEAMVQSGAFRADLYYRISVLPISIPALRERPGDIARLAQALLQRFNQENGRKLTLAPQAVDVLSRCYFPGNVRELENCVRRAATLAQGAEVARTDLACISSGCLSSTLWKGSSKAAPSPLAPPSPAVAPPVIAATVVTPAASSCGCQDAEARAACRSAGNCSSSPRQSERERLIEAMETAGWVQAKAARLLNLTPRQIGYALRKHDIEMKHF